ncbi:MAG: L,D-transpeptidase [Ignavibacterium album]|uniref:L,D-transpeptidase n=1 Tax=Ignavibacterium album TaxID=591197 RepID=UPI0026EFDAB7|nr:L,D-transpeptidase [Ignavibacterium album]MCX8104906.1 L,D-transpeptidase [Ignavibacterium album]
MKILLIIFISSNLIFANDPNKVSSESKSLTFDELKKISLTKIVDTLYTLSDYFVEIDLSKQMGYLHSRSDSVKTFKVSTGTKKIKDGVETNTGIFVIQHKAAKWYSTQFDSTLMLNWMGFNYGIGFHALAGKSYYKYLGNKTSSHGCVRVSREDAKDLFSKLGYGSPVIIHKGETAVKIAFAEKNRSDYKYYDSESLSKENKRRLSHLYNGSFLSFVNEKILIDHRNVTHQGISIGELNKVATRQRIYPDSLFLEIAIPEIKGQYIPVNYFSVEQLFAAIE